MDLNSMLERAFLEGYAASELTVVSMFVCIGISALVGLYIFFIYKLINRNAFYTKNFNMSLIALAIITSAVILTIQSNIVISLGMVGALSIVRFRTAVKDPMDLVFLFWSLSAGIICGAGFAMIAVIASAILTIVVVVLSIIPSDKGSMILIVNSDIYEEEEIMEAVYAHSHFSKLRARNVSKNGTNMAIEVETYEPAELLNEVTGLKYVVSASLVEHDGEVTA